MADDIQKVTLPFEDGGEDSLGSGPTIDGVLALSPADTATANAEDTAARLANYAQAWGISIPSDFTPATKAQVAYWRVLGGSISHAGIEGMRDGNWPMDLAPPTPTLRTMAERQLIVRRRRAWHVKRKWYAWLQYLRLTALPTLTFAECPAPGLPTYAELHVWEAVSRWLDGQPQCRARDYPWRMSLR